jgi:hypothetical protein
MTDDELKGLFDTLRGDFRTDLRETAERLDTRITETAEGLEDH